MNQHAGYRAYQPRPLAASERQRATFLFGGLHWRAEAALQAAFESSGLRARPLAPATREDLVKGRELADIGQCCPTAFVTGNLANHLLREQARGRDVAQEMVYLTAGSCGACRFGQYHQSYELALRNLGLEDFRIFLLDQSSLSGAKSIGLTPDLLMGAVLGIVMTDALQDLEYRTRPFEVEPGATDRAARAAVAEVCEAIRNRRKHADLTRSALWHLTTGHFAAAMRRAARHFEAVDVDRLRVMPVVKITGEFYLQTVEGEANYNIHRWLEAEGAEVYPAAVTVWLDYLLRDLRQEADLRRGLQKWAGTRSFALTFGSRLLRHQHQKMRKALGRVPHALPRQEELSALAAPFYECTLSGGEGDMLIGKAIWAHLHHKAHMICELSPYSCMPNTMSVGAMAGVLGRYPDLLYAPLEIKGDSEVHALSRCQMVLTEAKSRARQEFDRALAATGLTEAQARERLATRPWLNRPLTPVPQRGAVGTAANMVLELGGAWL